ncbi:MAG TPA: UvrB/UvrC motif-containing protein, partial [Syntrophales bacterium]|nr:UvrB/UvrC motif-containing protein [Syntrophales bacterium]
MRKKGGIFVYLRIDRDEPYPHLEVTRLVRKDGALYFGPYPVTRALHETLRLINRHFHLRTSSDHDPRQHKRPCLLCRISRLPDPAPCDIPQEQYREQVEDAVSFLEGRKSELLASLKERMAREAAELRFEEAARLRDRIGAVERTPEPRKVESDLLSIDEDGIGPHLEDDMSRLLERLRHRLQLSRAPNRIECFDVSHLVGEMTVASRVAMMEGKLDRDRYRRYRIRTAGRGDDCAALFEAVSRRLRKGLEENDLPDLIVLDGGKPQLSAGLAALQALGVADVDIVALAKTRTVEPEMPGEGPVKVSERIYIPEKTAPVVLPHTSPEMLLLVRLRDEAHRFA